MKAVNLRGTRGGELGISRSPHPTLQTLGTLFLAKITGQVHRDSEKMAYSLLDLPHEVLHAIFSDIDPQDLASLCCCRVLNDFITNDRLLYKELYLKNFV